MSLFSSNKLPEAATETKIAIVISQYNEEIGNRLLDSCVKTLKKCGILLENIEVIWVPGAFEIPLVAQKIAISHNMDAIITLGAVIRGGTPHFDYVCQESARGILDVQMKTGLPVIFGILTCNTPEQALERSAKNDQNKGHQCAIAAIEMVNLLDVIDEIRN